MYEFDFRCGTCKREYRFRDGKLRGLKIERDSVAEHLAMRRAAMDTVRNRRCPSCGGPLDDRLACDWCSERYSVEAGELVPRAEDIVRLKPRMQDFYVQPPKQLLHPNRAMVLL